MDRRSFLGATALAGAAFLVGSRRGTALSLSECEAEAGSDSCAELARHRELLARIEDALIQQGVSPEERQQLLTVAACPFCGQRMLAAISGEDS